MILNESIRGMSRLGYLMYDIINDMSSLKTPLKENKNTPVLSDSNVDIDNTKKFYIVIFALLFIIGALLTYIIYGSFVAETETESD